MPAVTPEPSFSTRSGPKAHEIFDVTRLIRDDPALGRRIHPRGPDIWAQVRYARDHEWAVTVDDITRRRTTLTIRGLDTPQIRDGIRAVLG